MLGTIELTSEEQEAASQIELARRELFHEHDPKRAVVIGDLAFALFRQLSARGAIPKVRLQYFAEPSFNASNTRVSKMADFLRNAGSEKKMYTHAHFWPYLAYFIHGPNLPLSIQNEFYDATKDTFRNRDALRKLARKRTREMAGSKTEKAELFLQLALDCGCDLSEALSVRNAVMKS